MWRGMKESASRREARGFGVGMRSSLGCVGGASAARRAALRMPWCTPKFHLDGRRVAGGPAPRRAREPGVSFRSVPTPSLSSRRAARAPRRGRAAAALAAAPLAARHRRREHGARRGAHGARTRAPARCCSASTPGAPRRSRSAATRPRAAVTTWTPRARRGVALRAPPDRRPRAPAPSGDHLQRHRARRPRSARCANRTRASIGSWWPRSRGSASRRPRRPPPRGRAASRRVAVLRGAGGGRDRGARAQARGQRAVARPRRAPAARLDPRRRRPDRSPASCCGARRLRRLRAATLRALLGRAPAAGEFAAALGARVERRRGGTAVIASWTPTARPPRARSRHGTRTTRGPGADEGAPRRIPHFARDPHAHSTAALLICILPSPRAGPADRGAAGADGGTLVISTAGDAQGFLPPLTDNVTSAQVESQLFDKLAEPALALNTIGDQGFQPRLATRWSWSSDSLSITFALDPRARWHDGQPVTARDVRFTWQVYSDPAVGSVVAPLITAIDSVTVRIRSPPSTGSATAAPSSSSTRPSRCGSSRNMSSAPIPRAQIASRDFRRHPVGSGPFRFVRWDDRQTIVLEANRGVLPRPPAPRPRDLQHRARPTGHDPAPLLRRGGLRRDAPRDRPDRARRRIRR